MTPLSTHTDPAVDGPLDTLRDARARFMEGFVGRVASIDGLVHGVVAGLPAGATAPLQRALHQLAGLAGTVGFPAVSERATELEAFVEAQPEALREAGARLQAAFDADAARPPDWLVDVAAAAVPGTVLVVEDDEEQQRLIGGWLRRAGHTPIAVHSGASAIDAVRAHRPALVLLDVELPGVDGYGICRQLKLAGDLSSIPVVFVSASHRLDARLTGLVVGADDYLQKPIDPRELLLRVNRLVARGAGPAVAPDPGRAVRPFDAFLHAAEVRCASSAVTVLLVRLPSDDPAVLGHVTSELRARDLVGRYDDRHLVVLMPGVGATDARARIAAAASAIAADGGGRVAVGAAEAAAGTRPLTSLIAEADRDLTSPRDAAVSGSASPPRSAPVVVVAEDDPDIRRIVSAQMRSSGYDTIDAQDGLAAIAEVESRLPDLLLVDLMMPKRTGFEVLRHVGQLRSRPRVVVLSARGREDDVTRAFSLGADDYITKPFNPQELKARVSRLLR